MTSENIRMMCPTLPCRSILNVPTGTRGKIVRCSRCGFRMKVPSPPKEADAGKSRPVASSRP